MWSYYGSKTVMVELYPKPKFDAIIEPFAGAAKYSLRHFEKDVILVDKYDVIISIWKWLQQCSEKDILSLPSKIKTGEKIRDYKLDCEEAYLFMGFIIAAGGQTPRNTVSPNCERIRPNRIAERLKNTASQLFKIRHWRFYNCDYAEIENRECTWFIDPPYQVGGHVYVESNKRINFKNLGDWCRSRLGQAIVCENTMADWMDFKPMKTFKGSTRKTTEAMWTNATNPYSSSQQLLF